MGDILFSGSAAPGSGGATHVIVDSGTITTVPPANASTNITEVGGAAITEGQKTMANSFPVVIASDQSAIPISGAISFTTPQHVITDTGSTTAITGTVAVTQSTSPWVVSGTVVTTPPANATTDVTQFGNNNVVTGTGVSGLGIPRVTVSSDSVVGLAAGTNVIGHVITDTGSTTAVTGNVTVIQPTGTNLHTVVDSGTVVVTQATGTNLHAVIDSGSITTVPPANASTNITQWDSVALGAPSVYGTSPGAIIVPGVNAFITNTPAVTLASTTITGTVAVTQSTSPWVISGTVTTVPPANASVNVAQWGGTNTSLGQKVMASSVPVVLASDQTAIPVTLASTTITGNVTVVQPTGTNLHVVVDSTSGTAAENLIQVAGVTLGATAVVNFGTAPAATAVPGVNSSIFAGTTGITATGTSLNVDVTNTVPVTLTSTTITNTVAENLIQVAGVTLGATAVTAFGTAPAAVNVPGVNSSIFAGTTGITATGTSLNVNVTNAAGPFTIAGNKSNNAVVPGATNLGVLPALANAASPAWTEGFEVLESVDLTGRQRFRGTLTNNNAAPAADGHMALGCLANAVAPTFTEGALVLDSCDLSGNRRVIGTKVNNTAAPTTQLGVIPAIANAAAPAWTEGFQVLLSEDLTGNLRVTSTTRRTSLTPASPTFVTIGIPSGLLVAANANRKGLVLTNVSGIPSHGYPGIVWLGFGVAATPGSGVAIYPSGVFEMGEYDFYTGVINAVGSSLDGIVVVNVDVAIQEFS